MIQINCTNCKSLLQIDDAFAGGVCRCRHCGTIQTVPKRLKTAAASTVPAGETSTNEPAGFSPAKRGLPDAAGSGTGLDDLAGIVASSGLTSGRLQKKTPPPPVEKKPATAWDRKIVALIASAAGVIILLLGVIIFLAARDHGTEAGEVPPPVTNVPNTPPTPPVTNNPDAGRNAVAETKLANFLGEAITEQTVVYVIDRGNSSGEDERLTQTKAALLRSLKSLGPTRRFKVLFWAVPGTEAEAWPPSGTKPATPDNIATVEKFLEDIYPYGATEPQTALDRALKVKPDVIFFVPIKGIVGDLPLLRKSVLDLRQSIKPDAKIHCFSLAQPDWAPALKEIADVSGGYYKDVPLDKLRQYAGQ